MREGALSDLKVVEFANFISGPFCAKLMVDLGAEVIKVEEPGVGDEARRSGPFPGDTPHPERSALFLYLNTNKLGVTLNLETVTGVSIFRQLIREADILVESNPPARMKELKLDYETLREVNPKLIMTSITPFGQTGPYRDYKTTDLVTTHMGGLAYMTPGFIKDPEVEPPLRGGGHQADLIAAVSGAIVTLSAVYSRQSTGLGQHIDLSQYEAMAAVLGREFAIYSYEKKAPNRLSPLFAGMFSLLPCKDGYYQLHVREDRQWWGLAEVMGDPDWAHWEIFKDAPSRSENWHILEPLLVKWSMEHTKDEICRACQAKQLASMPVNSIDESLNYEHLVARQFLAEIDHPEAGRLRYPGAPCKFSKTPWRVNRPAPLLGQHNEEVFCYRLGYSKLELVKMMEAGVI